jgi:hypothetical protein
MLRCISNCGCLAEAAPLNSLRQQQQGQQQQQQQHQQQKQKQGQEQSEAASWVAELSAALQGVHHSLLAISASYLNKPLSSPPAVAHIYPCGFLSFAHVFGNFFVLCARFWVWLKIYFTKSLAVVAVEALSLTFPVR